MKKLLDHKYEVDQSNKIEQTQKDTVLVITNNKSFSILIRSKDKRKIQELFRKRGEPRNFILFTFSAALAILLKFSNCRGKVVVDLEYKGSENIIRDRLKDYLKLLNYSLDLTTVSFGFVGKLNGYFEITISHKKRSGIPRDLGAFNAGLVTGRSTPIPIIG